MRHTIYILILIILTITFFANAIVIASDSIEMYLPQADELGQWEAADTPQYVVGDDLFLLINGGAEIYHEYGFKQAIAQGFKNKTNPALRFNLEIYEMNNPESAYGVYTFKTESGGVPVEAGSEALLEEYYINAWKGNFLVTVIGFTPDKETLSAIRKVAQTVTSKIKETSPKPSIINHLPDNNRYQLVPNGIKYIKGQLALFNQYDFDSSDIFEIKEGVVGNYGDFKLWLIQYADINECEKRFESVKKHLSQGTRNKDFTIKPHKFSYRDNKNIPFYFKTRDNFILIVQGKTGQEVDAIAEEITIK